MQWSRSFGGNSSDYCVSVQQTSDSGFVLAGFTMSFGNGNMDFWMVKTDANGDSLWSRTFGGTDHDYCETILQTVDDGYLLAGETRSVGAGEDDFWIVKTDANGDSLWSRTFGGSSRDFCFAAKQTIDGGYVLAGDSWSFGAGDFDVWMVKTDEFGDSLWSCTFGDELLDYSVAIDVNTDGGYLLAGGTRSYGAGNTDFWVVKTEPDPCFSSTPTAPADVAIINEGIDIRLLWSPVTLNVNNCPLDNIYTYLIWHSSEDNGDFEFHGFTSDTVYVHTGVSAFETKQFYEIQAYNGSPLLLSQIPKHKLLSRTERNEIFDQRTENSRSMH